MRSRIALSIGLAIAIGCSGKGSDRRTSDAATRDNSVAHGESAKPADNSADEPTTERRDSERIKDIEAEIQLQEKIVNESESLSERERAWRKLQELRRELAPHRTIRISKECLDNPLSPSCQ